MQLIGAAVIRQRTQELLDATYASRAGQATQEGFGKFESALRKNLK